MAFKVFLCIKTNCIDIKVYIFIVTSHNGMLVVNSHHCDLLNGQFAFACLYLFIWDLVKEPFAVSFL